MGSSSSKNKSSTFLFKEREAGRKDKHKDGAVLIHVISVRDVTMLSGCYLMTQCSKLRRN